MAKRIEFVPPPNRLIEVESIWKDAKPAHIRVVDPITSKISRIVALRAVHDGGSISFLAQWLDPSESTDASRAWVWSPPASQYYLRELPSDMFAIKFALSGAQEACMMTGEEGVYDVWQWRSGWNRLYGLADDRRLIITRSPPDEPYGETRQYALAPGAPPVYITWVEDEGRAPYTVRDRPRRREGAIEFGIVPQNPSGSRADVLAEAVYQEKMYLLELKRALETGFDDDYQFEGKGPHPFSIAITDDAEGQAHLTSGLVDLYLE